ncbi:AAA family ATPase [Lysinibacillus agricola]|uniref:AAA family ATPase n=1 Tax=Lysinibacillus agricola TaxID=2590012 RepID=A0ABX7AR83_9BACI|nr:MULTISPECIES: AAA family ATPase [Lysinibacillus]KOS61155.1 phosphohydrolase [Lysinibacillus sp. FJAT-14222]QQP12473.1 AAA family ATPase [Lysinibacillus agricola]
MKVIFTVGLPGSGKSTFVKELAKRENALILSSDAIRQELFGDATRQQSRIVFRVLYERLNERVANGQSVIVDATNIERERRVFALGKLPSNVKAICYYFDTPYTLCVTRNQQRKRKVPLVIMEKMRKNLEFPIMGEGFEEVHIVHEANPYEISKDQFISLIQSQPTYEELFQKLRSVQLFKEIYQFNQENPYHQFLLCQHTYFVYEYMNEYYMESDKLALQIAALFHDVGKPFCKKYKELQQRYGYYGHENVSAQMVCHFLLELGFEEDFVLKVVKLVQFHMLIQYGGDKGSSEIYHLLDGDLLTKLYFFREADQFAK